MDDVKEGEPEVVVRCDEHEGRECRIMCTECDVGLCDECLVCQSSHMKHALDEVCNRVNIGQELKQTLRTKAPTLRTDLQQIQTMKDSELQKKSTDIKHEITQTAQECINQIEKWQKNMEAKVDMAQIKMRDKTEQDMYQMIHAVAEQTITDIPDCMVKTITKTTRDLERVRHQIDSIGEQVTVFKITKDARIELGDLEYHQEEKNTFKGLDAPTIHHTNIKAISHGKNNIMIQTKESLFVYDFLPSHHYRWKEEASLFKHQSGRKLVLKMCPDGNTVIASKCEKMEGSTVTTTWVSNKLDFQVSKDYTGNYGELLAVSNERLLYLKSRDTLTLYSIAWHTYLYDIHAEDVCNAVMHPVSHRVAAECLAETLVLYHAYGTKQESQPLQTSCSLKCCCATLLVFVSHEWLLCLYSWSGEPLWTLDMLQRGGGCIYHMTCTDDQMLHVVTQDCDSDDVTATGKMMVLSYTLAKDVVAECNSDASMTEKGREIAFNK